MIKCSNNKINDPRKVQLKLLNAHLFFKMFGLIEAMALNPRNSRRDYWLDYPDDVTEHLYAPLQFKKRFNITESQFEHHLSFGQNKDNTDPWWPVRDFVTAFNKDSVEAINLGMFLI